MKLLTRLPGRLGVTGTDGVSNAGTYAYDYVIGGVPFMSAADDSMPMTRETAPYRKDQQDTDKEPGEQSLGDAWWRRSQDSFHGGAGLTWFESRDVPQEIARIRFADSKNLDVWTPGVAKRLPDASLGLSIAGTITGLVTASKAGVDYAIIASGNALTLWTIGGSTAPLTWGGSGTILSLTTDGSKYYVADNTGIYAGPVDGGSSGVKVYNNSSTSVVLGWVKSRLMAAIGLSIYELSAAGLALPTAKYTHPSANWVWRCFSEAPSAILAAGDAGGQSAIHTFTLDSSGVTPTLTAAASVSLPVGETVTCLFATAGSFLGIGTNAGVRVGTYDTYSSALTYGPLSVTTPEPVRALAARDRFLYAGGSQFVDDESCLIRVDLGQPVDPAGRLAHASDLLPPAAQTGDLSAVAVTNIGQRVVFAVDGYGVCLEGVGPGSVREAWLRTSRVRFGTSEPKLFRKLRIRGSLPSPTRVTITADAPTTSQLVFDATTTGVEPNEIGLINDPEEWLSLTFDLNNSPDVELRSWQVKALPSGLRQRVITLPLACYDTETDRNNATFGRLGYAGFRLAGLEKYDDASDQVLFEEYRPEGKVSRRVLIDKVSFRSKYRPNNTSSLEGDIVLALRTVD